MRDKLEYRANLKQRCATEPEIIPYVLEQCKRDIVFWFNNFCWTFDPRVEDPIMPFFLYPVQEWAVKRCEYFIDNGLDFGIEKSRGVGATWMLMLVLQHGWLFKSGWDSHVGSRKEAEVDADPKNTSTLFGKFRFNLERLPDWMKPKFRSRHLTIANLDNGNMFTGESANPSFGRGARKRCIVFDEMAFWPVADAAYGGCGQTTKSRAIISTPYGNTNRYAREMLNPDIEVHNWPGLEEEMRRKGLIA